MAIANVLKKATTTQANGSAEGDDFVRKPVKLSELPINPAQRNAIDDLITQFKKQGKYDELRKEVFAEFQNSAMKDNLEASIRALAELELEGQPSLLGKSRDVAAALIEGAAERSDIYQIAGAYVEKLITKRIKHAEEFIRIQRTIQIGEDDAREEFKRASKSDADYAKEAAERKAARTKVRDEEKANLWKLEEERRQQEDEERRQKEEEEEKIERERAAEDARRRKEREDAYEREKQERRERRRQEEERWADDHYSRSQDRDRDARKRDRKSAEPVTRPKSPVGEKDLESIALQELLKEGQMAAKSRQRPELEKDVALEPPPRRILPPKSLVPRDPRLGKKDQSSPRRDSSLPRSRADHDRHARSPPRRSSIRADSDRRYKSHQEEERSDNHYKPKYDSYRGEASSSRRRSRSRSEPRVQTGLVEADPLTPSSARRRSRDRSPKNIDRWMPPKRDDDRPKDGKKDGTSALKHDDTDAGREKRRHSHRDVRTREKGNDNTYTPSYKDGERPRERSRDRRDDRRERERYHISEIDRYRPGGSTSRRDDDRKTRVRSRSRERDSRERRSRSRSRDRRRYDREKRRSRSRDHERRNQSKERRKRNASLDTRHKTRRDEKESSKHDEEKEEGEA